MDCWRYYPFCNPLSLASPDDLLGPRDLCAGTVSLQRVLAYS